MTMAFRMWHLAGGVLLLLVLAGCTVSYSPEAQSPLPEPTSGTAAQQVIDFGSVQSAASVRVYQMSTLYGRGAARVAVV